MISVASIVGIEVGHGSVRTNMKSKSVLKSPLVAVIVIVYVPGGCVTMSVE